MFKKKEYIILLIIIIVLSVYLLKKDNNNVQFDIPELENIKKDSIKKVLIENSKGNISLSIDKKKWSLEPEGFPVLEDKVNKMIDLISGADLSDLISRAEKYEKYGLGEKSRTIIKAFGDKNELRELMSGNSAESGNRTFVKLKKDKVIYQARGNYKSAFDIEKNDIIDKKIYGFSSADIVELIIEKEGMAINYIKMDEAALNKKEIKQDKKTINPEKADTPKKPVKMVWVNKVDKTIVNDKEINSFISDNSNINCEKFIKKNDKLKEKGFISITFIDKTKKSYTLNLFHNKTLENEIFVSSNNNKFLFSLNKKDLEKINTDFNKFKK